MTDIKEYYRQYYRTGDNKDKAIALSTAWNKAHPEKMRAAYMKWKSKNRFICLMLAQFNNLYYRDAR